jgi:hypothetical protein
MFTRKLDLALKRIEKFFILTIKDDSADYSNRFVIYLKHIWMFDSYNANRTWVLILYSNRLFQLLLSIFLTTKKIVCLGTLWCLLAYQEYYFPFKRKYRNFFELYCGALYFSTDLLKSSDYVNKKIKFCVILFNSFRTIEQINQCCKLQIIKFMVWNKNLSNEHNSRYHFKFS